MTDALEVEVVTVIFPERSAPVSFCSAEAVIVRFLSPAACDILIQESPVTFHVPLEETLMEMLPPSGGISADVGDIVTEIVSGTVEELGSVQE